MRFFNLKQHDVMFSEKKKIIQYIYIYIYQSKLSIYEV